MKSHSLHRFALYACLLLPACTTISKFDQYSYTQATSIKVDALNVMNYATQPYDQHQADVLKVQSDIDKIYEYEKNRPKNETVQFGLWTVIISSSYVYLSLCKGDCAALPVNKTALVLMGIYSGMAAGSAIIDKNEINDNRPRHQNTPSQGFFVDILSDDNGISLQRFQNLVWSLIAVIVYLYKLAEIKTGCILPELSDPLLALTGLSSATYLVLRSKENAPPIQDASDPTATASQIDTTATAPAAPANTLVTAN